MTTFVPWARRRSLRPKWSISKYGDAPRAARRPDDPPHGAQSAPWGPRRSGARTAERGPHRASCARWGAISGIFEGGATQSAGMHRRPNAAGVSPRAVEGTRASSATDRTHGFRTYRMTARIIAASLGACLRNKNTLLVGRLRR